LPSAVEQLHRSRKDRKLAILAVDVGEDPAKVTAWVKQHGLTTPVLLDRDGAVASAYRVTATPTVVLIGPDGKLVARAVGRRPWDSPAAEALVDALLAGP
jgi:peroxiredoxin